MCQDILQEYIVHISKILCRDHLKHRSFVAIHYDQKIITTTNFEVVFLSSFLDALECKRLHVLFREHEQPSGLGLRRL